MQITPQPRRASIAALLLVSAVHIQAQYCDSLDTRQRTTAQKALKAVRIGSPCDTTLYACLHKDQQTEFTRRLENFACWMAMVGKDAPKIETELVNRYVSLTDTTTYDIAPSPFPLAGDPNAPVRLTLYIGAHCPLCKEVTADLYQSVTGGRLRGKATLAAKPFTTNPGDMALAAADSLGVFWQYFLALGEVKTRIQHDDLLRIARELKVNMTSFKRLLKSAALAAMLRDSKQEGRMNGVSVTPTIFINAHRYQSYKMPMWIEDAVEVITQ